MLPYPNVQTSMSLGGHRCLAAAPHERFQADVALAPQCFAASRRSPPEQRLKVAVIRRWATKWRWLPCVLIMSCPRTSPASEDGSRGRANERTTNVEEHAPAVSPRIIDILNATASGSEPGRPNYRVIGRALGLPEEITSLLDDFRAVNDGRDREKPQKVLARYFLNQAIKQVPFLSGLREHLPRGVTLKIDVDTKGVAVQIKVPLPALLW